MPTALEARVIASHAKLVAACNRPRVIGPISKARRNDLKVELALAALRLA